MATLPPPPQPLWDSNQNVRSARSVLAMIANNLNRIAREDFGRRDILTDAEIATARAHIADVMTNIKAIDTDLADPTSGFRKMSGGTGASLSGVSK